MSHAGGAKPPAPPLLPPEPLKYDLIYVLNSLADTVHRLTGYRKDGNPEQANQKHTELQWWQNLDDFNLCRHISLALIMTS